MHSKVAIFIAACMARIKELAPNYIQTNCTAFVLERKYFFSILTVINNSSCQKKGNLNRVGGLDTQS